MTAPAEDRVAQARNEVLMDMCPECGHPAGWHTETVDALIAAVRAATLDEVRQRDDALPTDLEQCERWIGEIEHWVDETVPQPALALMLGALRDLQAARDALSGEP